MRLITSDLKIVLIELGKILRIFSVVCLCAALIPVVFKEFFAVKYLLITSGLGFASSLVFTSMTAEDEPKLRHAMILAALAWVIVPLYSSILFMFIEKMPFIDSMFESVSGWSGTGLTMVVREDHLTHTIQFWRSLMQWIGGVGVIVLMISILARPGTGAFTLYRSEGRTEKIHPSIVSTVKTIWKIFLAYTVAGVFLLWVCGMPLWDAINHAMTGIATGGFSVVDKSIGTYNSSLIEFGVIPLMIAGAVSFVVHYRMIRVDYRVFFTDPQNKALFFISLAGVAYITYVNLDTFIEIPSSFRYSCFQFLSALTCTGFQTADSINTWSEASKLALAVAMVIGGAAGSTVGGVKLIRLILLYKGVVWKFKKVSLSPTAIIPFRLGSKSLTSEEANEEVTEAALISFLWVLFLFVGIFVLLQTVQGYTLGDVVFEVASAQGNVGLSTGITGPEMGSVAKVTLMFNMWIGRLEIIPVLMLIRLILKRGFM